MAVVHGRTAVGEGETSLRECVAQRVSKSSILSFFFV